MSGDIVEVPILDESGDCLFNRGDRYLVPIYQRAFAWGTGDGIRVNEIIQLMDDVASNANAAYRLGSLVVARHGERLFEVIDGQQRLTALFLILSSIGASVSKDGLSYACRPSAESALTSIADKTFSAECGVSEFDPASGIVSGKLAVEQKINSQKDPDAYRAKLLEKFKQVVLCRTVVPDKTDLNRYFEVMNTRGEQLEQQDIVKARLMRELKSDSEKCAFAMIWDACSDMNGYCQMHFLDTKIRAKIFGEEWTSIQNYIDAESVLKICGNESVATADNQFVAKKISFRDLVLSNPQTVLREDDSGQYSRFESIIDFRHFLLHALKAFPKCDTSAISLDDTKLIDAFEKVEKSQGINRGDFARSFIWHLMRCRCLFDRYVIKRVYDADGTSKWCLHELLSNENGGPSYHNAVFADDCDVHDVLMLESCLRVSFLDPKRMHWVTKILKYMISSGQTLICGYGLKGQLLSVAQDAIVDFFKINNCACLGVSTPHIVMHYLDYILWQKQDEVGAEIGVKDFAKDFAFEYRSSIEHWYPQTPPNGIVWQDCNRFGNLCILRGDINSKFSNLLPESKQANHEQYLQLEHQSLKLRIMAELTRQNGWGTSVCAAHEDRMLLLLKENIEE